MASLVVACVIFLIVLCRNFVSACGISFYFGHVGCFSCGMRNLLVAACGIFKLQHIGSFSCGVQDLFSCGVCDLCCGTLDIFNCHRQNLYCGMESFKLWYVGSFMQHERFFFFFCSMWDLSCSMQIL